MTRFSLIIPLALASLAALGGYWYVDNEPNLGEPPEIANEPSEPEEPFLSRMQTRMAAKDMSCDGFSRLETQACQAYQIAYGITEDASSDRFRYYYVIEQVNRVPMFAPSARYSLARRFGTLESPGTDGNTILDKGYGTCGNHAALFMELMGLMDMQSRAVQFFYIADGRRQSHIAAEVYLDGKWRYFDSTWGGFFLIDTKDPFSVASIEEVLAGKGSLVTNQVQPWAYWGDREADTDPYAYLKADPNIVYGYDNGDIVIRDLDVSKGELVLSHIPGFLGDNRDDGPFEGISYSFKPIKGRTAFTFDIQGMAGCDKASKLCVNDQCTAFDSSDRTIEIEAQDAARIHIMSPSAPLCYIVPASIRFTQKNNATPEGMALE